MKFLASDTPTSNLIKANIGGNILEGFGEGGSEYNQSIRNEDGTLNPNADRDEARNKMLKTTALNVPALLLSGVGEGVLTNKFIKDAAGKGFKEVLKQGAKAGLINMGQNGLEEGVQTSIGEAVNNKTDYANIVQPWNWSDEAIRDAVEGGLGAVGQSAAMGGGSYALNRMVGQPQQAQAEEQPTNAEQQQQPVQQRVQPKFANEVTTTQFADAVNVAMNDQSGNLVDRMRNLQGHITYRAKDGTNCARTAGLALAGTDYQDLINVDQFAEIAEKNGQRKDPATYVPKPGDLAVVNGGNHIVMVTENGGTIQNGSSADGVYESELSPQQMFGKVDYYISTSELSSGGRATQQNAQVNTEDNSAEQQAADETKRRLDAIDEVLGGKPAQDSTQQEATTENTEQQQNVETEETPEQYINRNMSQIRPITRYQDAFTQEELAGLDAKQRKSLSNRFNKFRRKNPGRTLQETYNDLRRKYDEVTGKTAAETANAGATAQKTPAAQQQQAQQKASEPNVEEATVIDSTGAPAKPQTELEKGLSVLDEREKMRQNTAILMGVKESAEDKATNKRKHKKAQRRLQKLVEKDGMTADEALNNIFDDNGNLKLTEAETQEVNNAVAAAKENEAKYGELSIPIESKMEYIRELVGIEGKTGEEAFKQAYGIKNEKSKQNNNSKPLKSFTFQASAPTVVNAENGGNKNVSTEQESAQLQKSETGEGGNQNVNAESQEVKQQESETGESREDKNKAEVKKAEKNRLVKLSNRPSKRIVRKFRKEVNGLKATRYGNDELRKEAEEYKKKLRAAVNTNQATPEEAQQAVEAIDKVVEKKAENAKLTREERIENAATGKTVTVMTEDGTKFRVQYKVVEAGDIVASNMVDGSFAKNPEYPQRLQPRNRQSAVSQATANKMAAELDPERLTDNRDANMGAPIIDSEGHVENGNLRMMAIMLAHAKDNEPAHHYEQYLAEHAEDFGLKRSDVEALERPVLVRERIDNAEGLVEKIIGSTTGGQHLNASEQAKQDAKALSETTLNKYRENEKGELNSEFVAAAINDIAKVSPNIENEMRTADGDVSQIGLMRIKNALFAKAYGDSKLLERATEATTDNAKSVTNALLNVAPAVAKIKASMESGKLFKADFAKPMLESANKTISMRNEGKSLQEVLQAIDMFGEETDISDGAKQMLQELGESKGSTIGITRVFNDYLRSVKEQNNNEENIVGAEEVKTADTDKLVDHWILSRRGGDLFAVDDEGNVQVPDNGLNEDAIKAEGEKLLAPEVKEWLDNNHPAYNESLDDEGNNIACRKLGKEFQKVAGVEDSTAYNSAERKVLRDKIRDYLYNIGIDNRKRERQATLVIGLSASGKSTISDVLLKDGGYLLVDADEAKKLLPEYNNGLLAGFVHEESSNINKKLLALAIENGDNICLPTVGGGDGLFKKIKLLKDAGYRVKVSLAHVPVEEAKRRVIQRFKDEGRFVDTAIIDKNVLKETEKYVTITTDNGEQIEVEVEFPEGSNVTAIDTDIIRNYMVLKYTKGVDELEWINNNVERSTPLGRRIKESITPPVAFKRRYDGQGLRDSGRLRTGAEESVSGEIQTGQDQVDRTDTENQGGSSISDDKYGFSQNASVEDDLQDFLSEVGVKKAEKKKTTKQSVPIVKLPQKAAATWSRFAKDLSNIKSEDDFNNAFPAIRKAVEDDVKAGKLTYENVKSIYNNVAENVKDVVPSNVTDAALKEATNVARMMYSTGQGKPGKNDGKLIHNDAAKNLQKEQSKSKVEKLTAKAASDEFGAQALKDLNAELSKLGANPMFNPKLWSAACRYGLYCMAKGAQTLHSWAKTMVQDVGEKIKPWLGALWRTLQSYESNDALDPDVMTSAFKLVGAVQQKFPDITEDQLYRMLVEQAGGEQNVKQFKPFIKAAFEGMSELTNPTNITNEINKTLGEEGANNGRHRNVSGQSDERIENPAARSEGLSQDTAPSDVGRGNTENDGTPSETAERVDNESSQSPSEVRSEAGDVRPGRNSERLGGNASEDVQATAGRGETVPDSGSAVSSVGSENGSAERSLQESEDGRTGVLPGDRRTGQDDTAVPGIRHGRGGNAERGRGIVSEDGTYEILPTGDYHIIDAEKTEIGGNRTKEIFKQNMLAFETLKRIQDGEDVEFTPETMNALARYTGWGRFRNQLFGGEYDKLQPQEGWEAEAQQIHDAMTKEEWENVRDSTDTAFYTPYSVTTAMWNLAKQLGLKHGNILEPSMGVGGFFATMPKDIFENSTLTGIEIEPTSGEIAKNLYPSAHVFVQGYEDFIKPNNSYDFIISNVPYASISMENTEEAKQFSNPKSVMIHDFFFLRGVNQLRPGGIMMALTSTGTMDKQDAQVRIALAQKAELVGAIRLPNKTFKQSGGTDVSCDLLVFRKRETPISYIEASKEPWINTKVVDESSAGKVVKINDYFAKNEQNIIGAAEVGSGRFGPTLNVNFAGSAEEFEQRLNDCIKENFPKNIMGKTLTKEESEFKSADISHPNRTFYMKNGDLMFRRNDEEVSLAKSGTIKSAKKMPKSLDKIGNRTFYEKFIASHPEFKALAIPEGKGKWEDKVKALEKQHPELAKQAIEKAYEDIVKQDIAEQETALKEQVVPLIELNEKYQELLTAETENEPDEVVEKLRKETRALFDKAVEANGGKLTWKTTNKNGKPKTNYTGALNTIKKAGDVNAFMSVAALDKGNGKPADILTKRILQGVIKNENPTVEESSKKQIESGAQEIDLDRIAKETKLDKEEVLKQLIKDNAVYETPEGTVVPHNIYLSGNVREKLKQAQAMAQKDERFKRNVDELMKVQPEQVTSSEITANIGANWISADSYKEFFANLVGVNPKSDLITVTNDNGTWRVKFDDSIDKNNNLREKYGDPRKSLSDVFAAAMNKKHLKVFDIKDKKHIFNEQATIALEGKVKEVNDLFNDWLWNQNDERREAMERKYNDEMNNTINPVYNADFIKSYPGMIRETEKGEPFFPKKHQRDVVLKFLTEMRGIAAHDAGTGKTLEMAMLCMQMRQTGKAKKPIIFAHNANSAAIAKDIKRYYPKAKVLYVQNVSKSASADETNILLSQMTSGDWDAIVLPHSLIDRVAFDEKTVLALRQEEIDYYSQKALEEANSAGIRLNQDDLEIENNTDDEFDSKGNYLPSKEERKQYQDAGATSVLDYIKKIKKIRRECHIMGERLKQPGYIDFSKTGIDCCLIDEAHEFKKGPKATNRQVRGLDTGTSDMGQYMDILTRYIHSIRDNTGVFEFTGTLLTNTIPEIHTHMRYTMPDVLKRAGIYHLDDFLGTFTEASSELEPTETGDFEVVERLRKFINITDLRNIAGQYIDIVTTADMSDFAPRKTKSGKGINDKNLTPAERDYLENGRDESVRPEGLPNKKVINVIVPSTKRMDFIGKYLSDIAKAFREAKGTSKKAMALAGVPLKLLTLAPSIGASIRNLHKDLKDLNTSKAALCVKNVKSVYDDAEKRGVVASQVIFMEKGYSDTKSASDSYIEEVQGGKLARRYTDKFTLSGYNMATDLKAQLVASGIPEEKIVIVGGDKNPYKDPTARSELCDKIRTGEVAVVIAQYGTMGVGANFQDNLRCVHHIDAPWMPGELEQENRRAVRQGNHWNTVREYRYITQGVDSKKWSALAAKVSFINAFMDKHSKVRVIESDAIGADEKEGAGDIVQSLSGALGDDRVVQLENKKKKKEQLEKQRRSFDNRKKEAKDKAKFLREKSIPELKSKIENVDVDMSVYAHDRDVNPDFSIQVRNPLTGDFQTFTDQEKAQSFIDNVISNRVPEEYENDMIRFRGFKVGVKHTYDVTGHAVGTYFEARSTKPDFKAEEEKAKQEQLLAEEKGEKKKPESKKAKKKKKEYVDLKTVSDDKYGKARYIPKQNTIGSLQSMLGNLGNSKEKWLQELPKQEELLNTYENQAKAQWKEQQTLDNINKQIADINQDLKDNKVPAPEWFRDRIKVGSIVEHNGNEYVVVGYSAPNGENVKDYGIMVENPVIGEEKRIRIPASEIMYNNEKPYTDEELKLDPRQRIEDNKDLENFTDEFKELATRTLNSYFGSRDWEKLVDIQGIERKYQGQAKGTAWTKTEKLNVNEGENPEDATGKLVTYTPPEIPGTFSGDPDIVDMRPIEQYQKINKLEASIAESTEPQIRRSVDELVDEVKEAFPGAKDFHRKGQHLMFIMPNGSSIAVDIANKVVITGEDAAEARKAHGKNADEPIRVNGYTMTLGKDAAIKLSQEGDTGTAYHEGFHVAYNLTLNDKEKAAFEREYGDQAKREGKAVTEIAADAHRDWLLARKQHKGTRLGKLHQKIKDFAMKVLAILTGTENVHNVMRKIAEGEVWNREAKRNRGTQTEYLVTNEKITGDTEVPVIDVTGVAKTNPDDGPVKKALAKTLLNRSFRIEGTDAIGFTMSVDKNTRPDGTVKKDKPSEHIINGTGPKAERTTDIRQQALTQIRQLLDNAVYIEKHPDVNHGSDVRYVDLYAAVQDGTDIYPMHIIAREKGKDTGVFDIKKVLFYDLKTENPLPISAALSAAADPSKGFPTISVAELLQNVKDKAGRPYVVNGQLQYEPAAIPALPAGKGKLEASISSVVDKGLNKAEAYANRNQRTANANTAEGRVGAKFRNTTNKNALQSAVSWLQEQKKNFYRDFVDKNIAFKGVDQAIEAITGKKLSQESSVYKAVQMMKALAMGSMTTLIEGNENSLNALRERIGKTWDTKNDPEKAERVKELKEKFKSTSMRDVMETINYKEMDKAHPEYLEKHGFNNWREAFGAYLGSRRLIELANLAEKNGITDYKLPVAKQDMEAMVKNAPKEFAEAAKKYYQVQENMLALLEDAGMLDKGRHDFMNENYHDYCPLMVDFSDTASFENVLNKFLKNETGPANVSTTLKYLLEEGSERKLISPLESTYKSIVMLTERAERNKVATKFVKSVMNDEDLAKAGIITKVEGTKSDDPKHFIFTVMENGQKVAYQTQPDLYSSIVAGNEEGANLAFKLAKNCARTLRAGATTSPSFIVRNFIRDTIFAGVSSRNGFVPVVDSLRGMKALFDPKLRGEYEAMGVTAFNFFGSSENAVKSLDQLAGGRVEIHSALDVAKALAHMIRNVHSTKDAVNTGLEIAGALSEFVENSTRMGEFMKARQNGKSLEEAALDAKEVTLDFSRSGRVGRQINQVVPFFNACIQGGDKMARLLADPETRFHALRMLGMYIMLPSMLLWIWNKDEPWYEEIDPHIRMNNWILPGGIRIPKPQEAGVFFGSGLESIMNGLTERDPKAWRNWRKAAIDALFPNVIPTLFLPFMEWQANYSFFREKAIEGNRLKRLPVEQRYNNSTSEFSKAIGETFGLSPVKLDNTIRGYLGTMGMFAAQMPDYFVEEKRNLPAKQLKERAFIRDFVLNDMNMNRTQEDFYDLVSAAQQQHAGYGKKGKPSPATSAINKALRDVSAKNKEIQQITNAKGISPERKRQLIDQKRKVIHQIQKTTLKKYRNKYDI